MYSLTCVARFHKVFKLIIPKEHYLRCLQLYLSWKNKNGLKQDDQSFEDIYKEVEDDISCNIMEHEPHLDLNINYEELKNFNIIQSDD